MNLENNRKRLNNAKITVEVITQQTSSCPLISSMHFEEQFKKVVGYQRDNLLHLCDVEPRFMVQVLVLIV